MFLVFIYWSKTHIAARILPGEPDNVWIKLNILKKNKSNVNIQISTEKRISLQECWLNVGFILDNWRTFPTCEKCVDQIGGNFIIWVSTYQKCTGTLQPKFYLGNFISFWVQILQQHILLNCMEELPEHSMATLTTAADKECKLLQEFMGYPLCWRSLIAKTFCIEEARVWIFHY